MIGSAVAQTVQQSGSVTRGHVPVWITSGVIGDGGSASNSPITSIGVTNNGGAGICVNSALPTAAGYNALCLGASTTGAATISLQNYGTATAQNIQFNINGSIQGFPTVTPLPVIIGNAACFSTTTGGLTTCGPITSPTFLSPTIDTQIIWDYSTVLVGTQSVANPAATAPVGSFISTFQGSTSGGTTALHVIPASGPLVSSTTTEVVTGATLGQAFGGNYGRWSYSNFASAKSGIVGEYGGTVTPPDYDLQNAVESPPSVFTVYEFWRAKTTDGGAEDAQVGAMLFGSVQPNPGTQQNRIALIKPSIGSAGTRNSDAILWEGKANNGTERAVWWHQFVNVTSQAGASTFTLQSNLNGGGYTTQFSVTDGGVLNVPTGYQIAGAATSGNVLRGNGTNFVSSTVAPGDLSGLGTGVATALGVNVGTAGAFIVNGGALGSPSSAGTLPAHTLGGTVSGGGNQINNVIIGTATPLAGSFTTVSATTSVTSPLYIGGSGAASSLTLESTSGAGTTDFIAFLAGSQSEKMRITTGGRVGMGTNNPQSPLHINANTVANIVPILSGPLLQMSNADGVNAGMEMTTYGTGVQPNINLASARGTAASKTATQSGDLLFDIIGQGYNGSGYINVINIVGVTTQNWTVGNNGAAMDFYTTANGSATTTQNMRLQGSGGLSLGTTTDPGAGAFLAIGAIKSNGATAGIGYATGAGGAVTQITNRNTGVTLNTITGAITLVSTLNAAVSGATANSVTVTDSAVAATDVVKVSQKSGTDLYEIFVTNVAAGSFKITFFTTGGTSTEQPVFNFAIIKAVAS